MRYAINPIRKDLTEISKQIAKLQFFIDKIHYPNHVDKWCRLHCNPYKSEKLKEVTYSKLH